jgi:D-glutamate N-acetyltransferase
VPGGTYAKTATGIIHWRRESCTGVWRLDHGELLGLPAQTPEAAVAAGARTLVIGVVNSGGILPSHWVEALRRALEAGLDLANGLHTRLNSIPQLVADAQRLGRRLHDVRYPEREFPIGTGARRTGRRLLTVGTDCAAGKMFTALTLERELGARGVDATFRATGQTGILIAGGGIAVDAVVSDFVSGAAEVLTPDADPDHWDLIEGQGSLFHPSFAAVSLGLLHGSQPDAMVLCHVEGRTSITGTSCPVPTLQECIDANEIAARVVRPGARVVGVSLNTSHLSDHAAGAAIAATQAQLDLPVGDPVRTGLGGVVDAVLASGG